MAANQITLILVPIAAVAIALYVRHCVAKATRAARSHGPRTPGAVYDAKELAVSKGNGMDGGVG